MRQSSIKCLYYNQALHNYLQNHEEGLRLFFILTIFNHFMLQFMVAILIISLQGFGGL